MSEKMTDWSRPREGYCFRFKGVAWAVETWERSSARETFYILIPLAPGMRACLQWTEAEMRRHKMEMVAPWELSHAERAEAARLGIGLAAKGGLPRVPEAKEGR